MTPRCLVSALLDAVDDVNPRQYLSDVPKGLLLEIRGALEKLGWRFVQMSKPNEAQYEKLARFTEGKTLLWIYVWQAKLYAYSSVHWIGVGWKPQDEMEQEAGQPVEVFAQAVDNEYSPPEHGDADDIHLEPPGMDEAFDPDEIKPKEFLRKIPERFMVEIWVDEEDAPEGVPPVTTDAAPYFATKSDKFIENVYSNCRRRNDSDELALINFGSENPEDVQSLRTMEGTGYIAEYIDRWGTSASMTVFQKALALWIRRARPDLAHKLGLTVNEALDPDEIKPKDYTKGMTPRDLKIQGRLIVIANPEDTGNPLVECPICHFRGLLMDDFSYLEAGFNGIKPGDEDDLDLQECGRCRAKLEWRHIPEVVESIDPDQPPPAKELFRQLPQSFESWLRAHGFEGREDKEFVADPELPVIQGQTVSYPTFERNTTDFVYTARKQEDGLWTVSVADWREGEDNIKGTQKFDLSELEAKKLILSWIRRHG